MSAVQTDIMRGEALMPSRHLKMRKGKAGFFGVLCMALTILTIGMLLLLLAHIARQAWGWIDWQFLSSPPSRTAEKAGLEPALFGTFWMVGITTLLSVPIGVMAAIYLEEYARDTKFNRFISIN